MGLLAVPFVLPGAARASATCSVAPGAVAFGVYAAANPAALDSTGTVTVTCTNTPPFGSGFVAYVVALSAGSSGSLAARTLRAGPHQLLYNLYANSTRTLVWGDGSAGSVTVGDSFTLGSAPGARVQSRSHVAYGRVPAGQAAAPGAYADTLVLTVTF